MYLTVSPLVDGDYVCTINNVEDLVGNAMENVEVDFTCTGFGIDDIENINASIYPNPATNNLNCEILSSGNKNLSIKITDLAGREIIKTTKSLVNGQNNFNLFIGDKKAGIYFLEMKTNDKIFVEKIIVK